MGLLGRPRAVRWAKGRTVHSSELVSSRQLLLCHLCSPGFGTRRSACKTNGVESKAGLRLFYFVLCVWMFLRRFGFLWFLVVFMAQGFGAEIHEGICGVQEVSDMKELREKGF